MLRAGTSQPVRQMLRGGRMGREKRGERGDEHEQQNDGETGGRERVAHQGAAEAIDLAEACLASGIRCGAAEPGAPSLPCPRRAAHRVLGSSQR